MTSLNSKLQLAMLNRKKGSNLLEKGFTLVELMIVIVIVGVLSSVALPNFLSQTGKAKGTEAKSQISSIMKNAAAEYQQGGMAFLLDTLGGVDGNGDPTPATSGIAKICENLGGPEDGPTSTSDASSADNTVKTLFDYDCTATNAAGDDPDTFTVVSTANFNDSGIQGEKITMEMNLEAGTIEMDRANTNKLFGGTLQAEL